MELRDEGYDNAQRLDFDFAVMAWWDQFESLRNVPAQVRNMPTPRKDHHWGAKYPNDKAILDYLMGVGVDQLDPVLEGVTADDLWDLMDGWDVDASA